MSRHYILAARSNRSVDVENEEEKKTLNWPVIKLLTLTESYDLYSVTKHLIMVVYAAIGFFYYLPYAKFERYGIATCHPRKKIENFWFFFHEFLCEIKLSLVAVVVVVKQNTLDIAV